MGGGQLAMPSQGLQGPQIVGVEEHAEDPPLVKNCGLLFPGHHGYVEAPAHAILDVVRRNPGCNLERLQRCSGIPRRQFEPTLEYLLDTHRVAIHANGQTKHVLPFVPGIRDCACQVLVLLKPGVPDLHAWHHQQGPCTRAALVSHAEHRLSWGEHLIKKRIQQMIECRLMRRVAPPVGQDQRVTWYEALDAKEPTKLVLAAYEGHERFRCWLQFLCPKHRS